MEEVKVHRDGFVQLIDVFGDDNRIAEVARGSYAKGTKRVSTDEQLIRYLVRHQHSSPLEFGQVLFKIKCPIFVARQIVRHRTAKFNEMSLRYSEAPDEMFYPSWDECAPQSTTNKQGRDEDFHLDLDARGIPMDTEKNINSMKAWQAFMDHNSDSQAVYKSLLDLGISRELARTVLPVSQYTEISVSWDVRNLLSFLGLRMDKHAQKEVRAYADAIHNLTKPHFPIVFGAWKDYIHNARTLSAMEQKLLARMIHTGSVTEQDAINQGMSKREYTEFNEWLVAIRK